jgi:hypothetical protein
MVSVNEPPIISKAPLPICWAECLGDCSKVPSCEHIVTESTLPGPQINVRGLPFLKGRTITLHKKQFKSNILCKAHNNALSQVDQAGTSTFDALRDATGANPRMKNKIDGNLLERWLLKTMINMEVLADFSVCPPPDVVEIAFGKRGFGPQAGLFLIGYSFHPELGDERVSYTRLADASNGNKICGGFFNFRGFQLLLMISNNPFAEIGIAERKGETKKAVPLHHPRRLEFQGSNFVAPSWQTLR